MYVCVYIHAHKQTHNLCIHVYMHTYTLAYHVYIHTYIHTYYTGTTIVNYAKAIVKTSDKDASMKNYQDFVVDIPPLVNASNFRKGSCNCLSFAQPIEHCVCVSGHDLTGQSAFYEYIEDTLTKVLSTALVLAGWPCKKQKFGAKAYGCVYMYMQYIVLGMYVYVANACMYFWHTVCIHIHTRKYAYAYV